MKISDIKITRLSKRKVQLDYRVPVYMALDDGLKIAETIKISIRYAMDISIYENYYPIEKSVDYPIQNLYFRNKVGSVMQHGGKYHVSGIKARYQNNVKIDGILYTKLVDAYLVTDKNYISIIRNKKLEEILK